MAKFEAGDRVRVRSDRGRQWNPDGKMDKYFGTEQTIDRYRIDCDSYELEDCFYGKSVKVYWKFKEEDLTLIEETDCIKDCENCKHFELDYDDFPCCECGYYEKYECCDKPSEDKDLKPKNYIAELMKDNGIEVGEEFTLFNAECLFYFDEDYRLYAIGTPPERWDLPQPAYTTTIGRLMRGELKVNKINTEVDDTCIGTDIEVSLDNRNWHKRFYIGRFENWYMCQNDYEDEHPIAWKYAREIKGN